MWNSLKVPKHFHINALLYFVSVPVERTALLSLLNEVFVWLFFPWQVFHEDSIISGYRHPRSSATDCVLSLFQLTNETLNVWTHFLPTWYSESSFVQSLLLLISHACFISISLCLSFSLSLSLLISHACFISISLCLSSLSLSHSWSLMLAFSLSLSVSLSLSLSLTLDLSCLLSLYLSLSLSHSWSLMLAFSLSLYAYRHAF